MIILAMETTARVASVALLSCGAVLHECECDPDHKHAETILPAVEELLRLCGMSLNEVDAFAVDVGPGSFTGVRIGVCTANAFAFACGKPVIAVDSLRALYQPQKNVGGQVCVLIDARNGNAYAAQYRDGVCIDAPRAVEIAPYCASLAAGVRYIGDVMPQCGTPAYPTAASVGVAAFELVDAAAVDVRPLYLRSSQAERLAEKTK